MSKDEHIKSLLNVLPELPGVYQYFNSKGEIIYVGKAKNLKRRVSSYFLKTNHNLKTSVLVSKICDIRHIVVETEKDAFLLENNLIKKYKPRYNILLKDDKTYPWICVKNEPFPRVFLTRNVARDGSVYYGPYTSGYQVKYLLELIHQLYRIRTCNLNLAEGEVMKGKYKECLKYHIESCWAPCTRKIPQNVYDNYISEVRNLLKGNTFHLLRQMKKEMNEAAENLDFEKAELLRQRIEKLDNYQEHSTVSSNRLISVDVFGCSQDIENQTSYVNYMKVQEGKICESFTMTFRHQLDETKAEILSFAIQEIKNMHKTLQREIVVAELPDEEFENTRYTIPTTGDKKKILELSEKNALHFKLETLKNEAVKNRRVSREEKTLIAVKENLGLKEIPRHIEIFDNSNIQGQAAVAACVVYKDGRPSKADYRKYNIKTVEGPDDYASMYEVAMRRYSRLLAEGEKLPDLIVADGGIGQMEVLAKVCHELKININILGLAKDNKHRTKEILIGLPPKIIGMSKNDEVFRFFTRMQDEVHRFAITFHRQKRSSEMTKSELDEIKGIGEKTKEKLMSAFKSVSKIKSSSTDELSEVIGRAKAQIVSDYYKQNTSQ